MECASQSTLPLRVQESPPHSQPHLWEVLAAVLRNDYLAMWGKDICLKSYKYSEVNLARQPKNEKLNSLLQPLRHKELKVICLFKNLALFLECHKRLHFSWARRSLHLSTQSLSSRALNNPSELPEQSPDLETDHSVPWQINLNAYYESLKMQGILRWSLCGTPPNLSCFFVPSSRGPN